MNSPQSRRQQQQIPRSPYFPDDLTRTNCARNPNNKYLFHSYSSKIVRPREANPDANAGQLITMGLEHDFSLPVPVNLPGLSSMTYNPKHASRERVIRQNPLFATSNQTYGREQLLLSTNTNILEEASNLVAGNPEIKTAVGGWAGGMPKPKVAKHQNKTASPQQGGGTTTTILNKCDGASATSEQAGAPVSGPGVTTPSDVRINDRFRVSSGQIGAHASASARPTTHTPGGERKMGGSTSSPSLLLKMSRPDPVPTLALQPNRVDYKRSGRFSDSLHATNTGSYMTQLGNGVSIGAQPRRPHDTGMVHSLDRSAVMNVYDRSFTSTSHYYCRPPVSTPAPISPPSFKRGRGGSPGMRGGGGRYS